MAECKVFAALRQVTPFSPNVVDDAHRRGHDRRFRQRFETLPDLLEGELENELALLELNVALLLDGDELKGSSHCPILRLKRNTAGEFALDSGFIPPCLHLSASPVLLTLVQRLIGVLQAKNDALSSRRRERADKVAEFGSSDVTLFWLLYTVNRAYPHLSHLLAHPRLSPVELFRFLSDLVASLMTFSTAHRLDELPSYQHLDAAASLFTLETRARELLDTVVPNEYIPIALRADQALLLRRSTTRSAPWRRRLLRLRPRRYARRQADRAGSTRLQGRLPRRHRGGGQQRHARRHPGPRRAPAGGDSGAPGQPLLRAGAQGAHVRANDVGRGHRFSTFQAVSPISRLN